MTALATRVQNAALSLYGALSRAGIMRVPLVRGAFLHLYRAYKVFEAGPIDALGLYVRPGDAVIDIGANIGVFTYRFAHWTGPAGKVIAVEPESVNFTTLANELSASHLTDRVEAVCALCADKPGVLHLVRNEEHPGDHKIALNASGPAIEAVTLDQLSKRCGDRLISLIKIDVQGAELMVLQGATETLRIHKPALFIEIDEGALKQFGASSVDIIDLLGNAGYDMHRLRSSGATPLSAAALGEALSTTPYIDVLFLKR